MNNNFKMRWVLRLAAGAAMIALANGCQDRADLNVHGEDFLPPDAERSIGELCVRQSANAAYADATVRAYHFDGNNLNSLGEERLTLIVKSGEAPTPLTVYLDLPADDARTGKRQNAVIAYLKDRGLTEDQIEIKSGPNPNSNSPVAPLLAAQAAPGGAGAAPVTAPPSGSGH